MSGQMMGRGENSTQMSLDGVAEVGEMVHLGGTSWIFCHMHCFSPSPSTVLLRPFPLHAGDRWQIGKALLLILWCQTYALQGCEVQALFGEEEAVV